MTTETSLAIANMKSMISEMAIKSEQFNKRPPVKCPVQNRPALLLELANKQKSAQVLGALEVPIMLRERITGLRENLDD
jgi:hypothetical protein